MWEFGISKRRLLEGDDPQTSEEWLVGHPLLFPAHLALGNEQGPRFEFRVPVDDTHLLVYSYFTDVTDRTTERLGASDRGIILYRQVLLEQIERVERGEDPMGVIRDPARHTPFLSVPRERAAFFTHAGGMVARPEIYAEDPLAFVRGKRGG